MGARISAAMEKARTLILQRGFTQAEAAKVAGVTAGAISRAPWYREHMAEMVRRSQGAQPGGRRGRT